ncbi:Oplophorus-luciferin 2-monooxygenase non-catalytic subunit [Chionoecetes opilio]|uniref:Oplophorus-luciferin 2-monooxygenase non-catalytic subunit n=1 Tax=Chionoecetes opilio TaxID=41210 RepID=A0A8J4YL58_CHIOP|nr:Oplophorus-luciferin 2-monooxygenase non-catalytic subunit [Chionoecetes opilio]
MAWRCVLVVVVAAAMGLASSPPAPEALLLKAKSLPCPPEANILPCTCHASTPYGMTLDCSLINTNDDLHRVFDTTFPFKNFQKFIIKHDPGSLDNKLTEITKDTFHKITFVNVIIQGTQIQSIDENVFSYSHETLRQLDLRNNKINDFPFESMVSYTELDTLLLDHNELPKLEKFSSASLVTLSIGNNPNLLFTFDVLENIPKLENLNMEGIGLRQIPQHMFINLTSIFTINFNDNDLTKLEEYTLDPPNTSVGRLLLANNRIYTMLPDALTGCQPDAIIDLANNDVTELTQNIWQPLLDQVLGGGNVYMTGNPLKCGCDMDWMFLNTSTTVSADVYPPILTDYTTCFDGTQVRFLDVCIFEKHCGSNSCVN